MQNKLLNVRRSCSFIKWLVQLFHDPSRGKEGSSGKEWSRLRRSITSALAWRDMEVSWSRPGQALISGIAYNWRKRRCQNKLYHDHLKRDLQAALRAIPKNYNVDAYIDKVLEVLSQRCAQLDGLGDSVLIIGPCRVGKSTIARIISHKGHHIHVPIDMLSMACKEWPDPLQRDALLYAIIHAILLRMRGVILEGGAILSWPDMSALSRHAHVMILGDVSDCQSRADCIASYRNSNWCWTSLSVSDEGIHEMAKGIIERSRELEARSKEFGVPFIGLRGSHSEADIQHASEFIWARVKGP